MASTIISDMDLLVEAEENKNKMHKSSEKAPRKMYLAALAVLMYPVAMGMAAAYSATATENMKEKSSRVRPTDEEVSWIGSLLALGALVGGLVSGYLSNKFGRKGSLVLCSASFLAGWLFIAYAPNVYFIYVGRTVTGICAGLVCVTVPSYLVEISTPEVRGFLGASFQLFVVIGVLLVAIFGSFLTWNWLAIAGGVAVVFALNAVCFIPESPRWLVAKGRYEQAVKAVAYFQGPHFDAAAECVAINEDICLQPKGKITIQELLQPSVYKPAFLSICLVFFQQACGSNAILFYTVSIFKESSSVLNPDMSTIVVDAVLVLATAVSTILVDRAGRKVLLIISSLVMALSLILLGLFEYFKLSHKNLASNYSWIPLACIVIYIAAFSLGFGPAPWLMMAEMSPIRMRSFIGGMATAVCWGFVFIVTKTFETLVHNIGDYGSFWLYGAFSIMACFFTVFMLPETKGKSFEEIQEHFVAGHIFSPQPVDSSQD